MRVILKNVILKGKGALDLAYSRSVISQSLMRSIINIETNKFVRLSDDIEPPGNHNIKSESVSWKRMLDLENEMSLEFLRNGSVRELATAT